MLDKVFTNNQVTIAGEVVSEFTFSHEVYGEHFYVVNIAVCRLSNSFDVIPVMVSERLMDVSADYRGCILQASGQFRSYNRHEETRNRLVLSVFAREASLIEPEEDDQNPNYIFLDGYVCKHLFTRKVLLTRNVCGYIVLPGGFGTLDELFDVLTLMNTKIQNQLPLVLLGIDFWSGLIEWMKDKLLSKHYIREDELECISLTDSVDEAVNIIKG